MIKIVKLLKLFLDVYRFSIGGHLFSKHCSRQPMGEKVSIAPEYTQETQIKSGETEHTISTLVKQTHTQFTRKRRKKGFFSKLFFLKLKSQNYENKGPIYGECFYAFVKARCMLLQKSDL